MSLELVNTLGTLTTVAIIAATAIAAMVQLRHMRAGNQINAMMTIGEEFSRKEFADATRRVSQRLAAQMDDPAFREFVVARARGEYPSNASDEHSEVLEAARTVANAFEELGILLKNGIADRTLFLDRYCWVIYTRWNAMQNLVGLTREAAGQPAIWENFEYLAVLSEDWIRQNTSTYPKGVRRMPVRNPWPLAPARS